MNRVFVLSPARSSGRRAQLLTRPEASFELARQVRIGDAKLGDVFTFCSGLYFRGKLAYGQHFAQPPDAVAGVQIITPTRGLVSPETRLGIEELREFVSVAVAADESRFTRPLQRSAEVLAATSCEVILLGSIATGKYVDCLLPILTQRLLFPSEFVGRGDMSRGALLLRCVAENTELNYVPLMGAVRRGQRPGSFRITSKRRLTLDLPDRGTSRLTFDPSRSMEL
jgi:hypothetical protein